MTLEARHIHDLLVYRFKRQLIGQPISPIELFGMRGVPSEQLALDVPEFHQSPEGEHPYFASRRMLEKLNEENQ